MQTFQYEALKSTGQSVKGTIEADSLEHARELLRAQGYLPVMLRVRKKHTFSFQWVTKRDIALFTRQLATLLAAGVPIEESLLGVAEQSDKLKVRDVLMGVRAKVLEGFSLGQALGEYSALFSELYRITVSAGEQTGRLDKILLSLADYTDKQEAMKQKIQHALIYPSVMMVISFAIVGFLLVDVVPTMIQVFTDSGQVLPVSTRILLGMSQMAQQYGLYVLVGLAAFFWGFYRLLKDPKRRYVWHGFLLKLPMVSYFIQTVNVTRYIHTFSMLFAAGVTILETMRVSALLIQNEAMRVPFHAAVSQVREGRDIMATLKDTHFVPPMALHLIGSGEKSGRLAEMMHYAAVQLDHDVTQLIETGLALLEPLMIVVMGGVVLFIVLATLVPIFSMEQMVG